MFASKISCFVYLVFMPELFLYLIFICLDCRVWDVARAFPSYSISFWSSFRTHLRTIFNIKDRSNRGYTLMVGILWGARATQGDHCILIKTTETLQDPRHLIGNHNTSLALRSPSPLTYVTAARRPNQTVNQSSTINKITMIKRWQLQCAM